MLCSLVFPADFSPSVGKSTSGKLPVLRFGSRYFGIIACVTYSLLTSRCTLHVRTLTAMQSYVTSHLIQCANIPAHLNRKEFTRRTFPDGGEGRGEKSAGHETRYYGRAQRRGWIVKS